MKLTIESFPNGGTIPRQYAFGVPDPESHATFGKNRNPHLTWTEPPEGTKSLAIICHDSDAPTVPDDVNKEGRTVPVDLPRANFFHWVLVDIDPAIREIPEAAVTDGVTPRGKDPGRDSFGKSGWNDYTGWFKGDSDLEGVYGGYDGPWPPWNDERLHNYHFTLYALDVPTLDLPESFGGEEAMAALKDHVLAQSDWTGTYAIYGAAAQG